jgi:hypothetical protein
MVVLLVLAAEGVLNAAVRTAGRAALLALEKVFMRPCLNTELEAIIDVVVVGV